MKRRRYGINLDDGTALASDEEFDLLYVPCNTAVSESLHIWFGNNTRTSLLFTGQIGSGKTTLLKEVARRYSSSSITLLFDTAPVAISEGGFLLVILGGILKQCLQCDASLDGSGIRLADFPSLNVSSWDDLSQRLTTRPRSIDEARKLNKVSEILGESASHVFVVCDDLLNRIFEKTGEEPIIIAEGVDKFHPSSPDYFLLKSSLEFLSTRKTLFECNASHLFHLDDFSPDIEKLFLGKIKDVYLSQVLKKRLGSYSSVYDEVFPEIIKHSGGNVRQAIRILGAYHFQKSQPDFEQQRALKKATLQVASNLLEVSFQNLPIDVFTAVKRDKYIETSLFHNLDTRDGAIDAIYHNWLLLESLPSEDAPTHWPTSINPLLPEGIITSVHSQPTREEQAIRTWAEDAGLSDLNLNAPTSEDGTPKWDVFWQEVEETADTGTLHIQKLLHEIASGLFCYERQDRIIITFQNALDIQPVKNYLKAKASTYIQITYQDIILTGGNDQDPIQNLLVKMCELDPHALYSIELDGEWTPEQLRDLDRRRDMFSDLQMLWWIEAESLRRYLPHWPQLRQFFRIYNLDEDLWRGVQPEEIQSDIEFLESMTESGKSEEIRSLTAILNLLAK
ncbi:MAG: ATP-binding protein [Verrucomicrobiales bacterium]|nr:ATP-binding protein [Verrucomicrobiales bacterium]